MTRLRLHLLGGTAVLNGGQPLGRAAAQPKRLAVLALLARAGRRGLSRDQLLAYLWPELDASRARNALNQTLFALRRDLSEEDVIEGTATLRLNGSLISSDLQDFEDAINAGDLERAVGLYEGPLLDGLHLRDAPEFESWIDQQRAALASRQRRALVSLAVVAERQGDKDAELRWLQQLLAADPYSADAVRRLAECWEKRSDLPNALREIENYARRIDRDLSLPPEPSLLALADRFRAVMPRATVQGTQPRALVRTEPIERASSPVATSSSVIRGRRRWTRGTLPVAAVALLALSIAFGTGLTGDRVPAGPIMIAVLPFDAGTDSSSAFHSSGVARLVAEDLDGLNSVRATVLPSLGSLLHGARTASDSSRALARRFRIDRYVSGSVTRVGGSLRIVASLHDATSSGEVLGTAILTGLDDSLFVVADGVSRRIWGFEPSTRASELVQKAAETTNSQSAFRAFVEGEEFFRASRYADAVAAFQRAVTIDSTFALAHLRLSAALDWNAQGNLIPAANAAALRFAHRLPWRERALLEGTSAWRSGRNDEAESKFRQITTRYPNDVEAWFQLGEVMFHSNSIRGRSFLESEGAFRQVIRLDPANRGALTHVGRLRAYVGDARGADSALRAAAALMNGGADAELALFRSVVTGDRGGRAAALARLDLDKGYLVTNAAQRLVAYDRNFAEADTVLSRAIRNGLDRGSVNSRRYWSALVAAGQGQFARAFKQLDALAETDPGESIEFRALLLTLPYVPQEPAALTAASRSVRGATTVQGPALTSFEALGSLPRLYLLGLLAGRAGDARGMLSFADSLDRHPFAPADSTAPRVLSQCLRGLHAAWFGAPDEGLRALAQIAEPGEIRGQIIGVLLNERYSRARLLEQLNRPDEALAFYGSLIFGEALTPLAIQASLQRARLLSSLARVEEARRDYQVVINGWKNADQVLQPVVDSARVELARLR